MNQTAPTTPRFDSNRAWQDATAAVAGNRDVLIQRFSSIWNN